MQTKKYIIYTLLLFSLISNSQIKIGQWVDHLSYNNTVSVAKVNNNVYFTNGQGLAKYNTDDNSVEKITKINGLTDIGVKILRKNTYNNYLLVIYENTNIDIIKPNGEIINISDIKRKTITGRKNINEVYFNGKFAYISCGFGIVVFDTEKLEVKETFYLGNGVKNYNVYQITKNDTAYFAATDSGLFVGNINANLRYEQNWKKISHPFLNKGPYNFVGNFNNTIIANYSCRIDSNKSFKDVGYQFNGTTWSHYLPLGNRVSENIKVKISSDKLFFACVNQWGLGIADINGNGLSFNSEYNPGEYANMVDADTYGANEFWIADNTYGLVHMLKNPNSNSKIKVNGPANNLARDLAIKDGQLLVAPVDLGGTITNQYNSSSASMYSDNEWLSLRNVIPNYIQDINSVAIDPNDKNHIAFACMGSGLMQLKNKQFVSALTHTNSGLIPYYFGTTIPLLRLTGVNIDKNSNIWNSVSLSKYIIQILKKDNTWKLLDFSNIYPSCDITKIIFTKKNHAFIVLARTNGLLVYNDLDGLSTPNASNCKLALVGVGKGNLPSSDIKSLCEDLDGKVWIGTTKGITVFYNPDNFFNGGNWDAQQILIEQDGNVQNLLEDDEISAIAVDGANRKWVGTQTSGLYCFSSDGQIQIHHFTFENSPLYSNTIKDIVIDETSGDVYIASENGIQSFRTPIIKGSDDYSTIHAYPNPVRPGSSATVYIKGLVDESIIKITDVAGNLVYETKSQGGQIEWNMQNFSGARVITGTYLINCSTANGELKGSTKLMVVN